MSRAEAAAFRRWCWRVLALVRRGTPFRVAIHRADVAAELDRAMQRCAVHPGRVSQGGAA